MRALQKRMIRVEGRIVSIRLEAVMWAALHDVAAEHGYSVHDLVTEINRTRGKHSLPIAIRNYVVEFSREILRKALAGE